MKPFEIRVLDKNKNTKNITTSAAQQLALDAGLLNGSISALHVKVKETNELIYAIPAKCCSRLVFNTVSNLDGTFYHVIDLKPALDYLDALEFKKPIQQPTQFLIEGVDRLGKSTLIQGLQDALGYHLVVHYEKPKKLKAYADDEMPLLKYQEELYSNMFAMIHNDLPIIFDRAHLGEAVYAPMYRKYSGEYVFEMEKGANTSRSRLVLLTTSDFSFIKDDGLSLDFNKKEEEQALFIEAFKRSNIEDKVIIDVSNGNGSYKSAEQILAEVLKK